MKTRREQEWIEDFCEFVQGGQAPAPDSVTRDVLSRVRKDLNPAPLVIFGKLFGVHAVVGTFSLSICNQFGMNPFGTRFSLADYFMTFGHSVCMTLCGVLFISLTIAVGGLLLRPEELRVFSRNSALLTFGLASVSLGVFAAFGAEIALAFGFLWLAGALIGGVITGLVMERSRTRVAAA